MKLFSFRHGGSEKQTARAKKETQKGFSAAMSEAVERRKRRIAGEDVPPTRETRAERAPRETRAEKETHATEEARRGLSGKAKGRLLVLAAAVVLVLSLVAIVHDQLKTYVVAPTKNNSSEQNGEDEDDSGRQPNHGRDDFIYDPNATVDIEVLKGTKENFYNILIVGTDGDGTRTDTIMIANLNAETHTVGLMSVPRDTLVYRKNSIPKINSIYGINGQGERGILALEDTLEDMLGFRVDGYVIVNLKAFEEIVDLVDGVDFYVPQDMYYNDPTQDLYINLKEGMQHLDGKKAIQLCRFRKGYATQDIRRTQVQQEFLQALAKKCLNVSNVSKINEFASLFYSYVQTDLTIGNIAYLGMELLECDFDSMVRVTLPGEAVMIKGGSYYQLYPNATLKIINETFNPYDSDLKLSDLNIRNVESIGGSSSSSGGSQTEEPVDSSEPENSDEPENPDESENPDEPPVSSEPDGSEEPPESSETPPESSDAPHESSEEPAPSDGSQPSDGADAGSGTDTGTEP